MLQEENEKKKKEIDSELREYADLDTKAEENKNKLQKAVSILQHIYICLEYISFLVQEEDLREAQNHTDVNKSLGSEYESLQKQKKTVDAQVSQLQEELNKLSEQAAQRGSLEALRKKKEEAEIEISKM